ncbi:lasso peptide biosynthesis B2 protein [Domibacillus sp.]|uniref:lasso peptide biosynthesis B2 protein n=1 Tax=Domibacillus sp. TaxID=1969783 RepID=UPI002811ED0B|nr:lasso peptide biosynthesis B2 protein [Domibacillus sp.]
MKLFTKARAFFKLDVKTRFLLIEAFFYLAWGRYQKRRNFSEIAPSLGVPMKETMFTATSINLRTSKSVSSAIRTMSHYTFWESACLVKALAALKMLEKRNIESTLYLGTAKDKTGKLVAHAWLRSGSFYVSGFEEMENFTVVAKFAKEINIQRGEGASYDKDAES